MISKLETMVLQEQSQIKTMAKKKRQNGRQTCTQTATFESCSAKTNKGVTDLNIELKRQKLDQTVARNIGTSLKSFSFLAPLKHQTWLANTDGFPAFVSRRRKV